MSLKTTPALGKSGTSRIFCFSLSTFVSMESFWKFRLGVIVLETRRIVVFQVLGLLRVHVLGQEEKRIAGLRPFPHLEMKMRARGAACASHAGDDLSLFHLHAHLHKIDRIVRVNGEKIALVLEKNQIAVASHFFGVNDFAVGRG